ncbi:MAG: exodeoxyribonuclease VII large subunit [Oligoflexia bacterium]|nr:exodeoxyribonuclease VII large subunit [Oligoflexia bacterium]
METFTVSQILFYIKDLLEDNFIDISIEGEISNLSESSSGHYYFTLSDDQSSISAVLFKGDAFRNPLIKRGKLKGGDKIICQGSIGVYSKRGTFQLIVKKIAPAGKGDLLKKFEELKQKLLSQGLFDPNSKKKIPLFPRKIALITALNGAALQDFLQIYKRRSIWTNILVIPALVQGDTAARSLVSAINKAHSYNETTNEKIDVLVLCRGGGSMEDLWCFNDENLALQIFKSKIPTISAVGHHVDFTIADFVADLRAETPSAAAEILTAAQTKLIKELKNNQDKLMSLISSKINQFEKTLYLNNPKLIIEKIIRKNNKFRERLFRLNIIDRSQQFLKTYEKHFTLDEYINTLKHSNEKKLSLLNGNLENYYKLLTTLDPKETLNRGYCYITDPNNNNIIINNLEKFKLLPCKSTLNINFSDGQASVKCTH